MASRCVQRIQRLDQRETQTVGLRYPLGYYDRFHGATFRSPDRRREVCVVGITRYHMPVHVRHLVAQAREVDFLRCHDPANYALDRGHNLHQMPLLRCIQIRKLGDMGAPDHPAKTRVIGFLRSDHAQPPIAPQQLAAGFFA